MNSVSEPVNEPFLLLSQYFCLSIRFSPQSKLDEKSEIKAYLLKRWILNLATLALTMVCHTWLLPVSHTDMMTWTHFYQRTHTGYCSKFSDELQKKKEKTTTTKKPNLK